MGDRKPLLIGIVLLGVFLLAGVKFFLLPRQPSSLSALRVDSFPKTTVSLNDKPVGETPYYTDKLQPGEYKIKLIPAGATPGTFTIYEAKIKLSQDTLTYLSRNLGSSDELSSGQLLTLDKLASGSSAELAIISDPDSANVTIDSLDKGRTSLILRDLDVGDHEVVVSLSGYSSQIIKGRIIAGYRLSAIVKLAKLSPGLGTNITTPSAQVKPTSSLIATTSSEIAKPYVIIKDTPTGFLRVRSQPSLAATESGKVYPGEKYPLLDETADWDKISVASFSGWVSDQYIDKVK